MTQESLDDGLVGANYYDVLHILLPYYANDVDSTLNFQQIHFLTHFH